MMKKICSLGVCMVAMLFASIGHTELKNQCINGNVDIESACMDELAKQNTIRSKFTGYLFTPPSPKNTGGTLSRTTVCNRTGSYTYNDDVTISTNSTCTWQSGTITINGRLIVPEGSTLNIQTNSSYSETVTVTGVAGDNAAVYVRGTMNLTGQNNNKHVTLYIGAGKRIYLEDSGYLHATSSKTVSSRTYFRGYNSNSWYGIEARDRGMKISIDGGLEASQVRFYNIAGGASAIKHIGGESLKNALLDVKGMYVYSSGVSSDKGIVVNCDDQPRSTRQYYSDSILITDSEFVGIDYPIYFLSCYVDNPVIIDSNEFENVGSAGATYRAIRLEDFESGYNIEVINNIITDVYGQGIYLNNVYYGSLLVASQLKIELNTITGVKDGILVDDAYQDRADGQCDMSVSGNSVEAVDDAIQIFNIQNEYITNCRYGDSVYIHNNTLEKDGDYTAADNHTGIYINKFTTYTSDVDVSWNEITGFEYGIAINENSQEVKIYQNDLYFGSAPSAINPKLILSYANLTTIGGPSASDGNYFGTNGGDPFKYHIYLYGSSCGCNYNTFADASPNISGIVCTNNQ